jgi:hypothetical protein
MTKYNKEWYQKNKQRLLELGKKRYLENIEEVKKQSKEYYLKNREKRLVQSKKWQSENKAKHNISSLNFKKRHKKESKLRKSVWNIKIPEEKLCEKCNKDKATEIYFPDYSKPINYLFVCKSCLDKINLENKELIAKLNPRSKERKEKRQKYYKTYMEKNPEKIKEIKEYQKKWREKNKIKLIESRKIYRDKNRGKFYTYKHKHNYASEYQKRRKLRDKGYAVMMRLRSLLHWALTQYSETGKVKHSNEYGIDYKAIIEHLKPFPKDMEKYHIDHIIPLSSFDLTNPEEVKKAFVPENHQWLLAEENLKKGKKIIHKKINQLDVK